MISSAIWGKKTRTPASFSKTSKKHESEGPVLFVLYVKHMLLLFHDVHENILGNVFTTCVLAVLHPLLAILAD